MSGVGTWRMLGLTTLFQASGLVAVGALGTGCNGDEPVVVVNTPEIAVAPADMNFGAIGVLREDTQTIYVSNAGKAVLNLAVALEDETGMFTYLGEDSYQVGVDESVELSVTFSPETFLTYEGRLVLTHNDDPGTTVVALTGEGVDLPTPDIVIDTQTLDFGSTLIPGVDSEELTFRIENIGDEVLVFTDEIQQSGAGTFEVLDQVKDRTVAPGDYRDIDVRYTPIGDQGDAGTLTVLTNDPDEPSLDVQLLGFGGGDFEYPEAVFVCPDNVGLAGQLVWVDLDGSGSFDPLGYEPLTYDWSVDAAPAGSSYELINDVLPNANLKLDVAGSYDVSLRVTNALDAPSVPARCTITAVPEDEIHVELTWDGAAADLDLHLWQDGFGLFSVPEDANYCNPAPDWGSSGSDDNPRLDIDDRGGFGPENINIRVPEDNAYHVGVHYFSENGDGAVVARVKVWSLSTLLWEGTQVMTANQVWEVGQINWPDATFAVSSAALESAGTQRTCE